LFIAIRNTSDHIVAYSDGLTETKNIGGEMFGTERLETLLTEHIGMQTPLKNIKQSVDAFHGSDTHDDDITLMDIQC
jgi:serine phosphatase RsbU (regulator of sigma subunit)